MAMLTVTTDVKTLIAKLVSECILAMINWPEEEDRPTDRLHGHKIKVDGAEGVIWYDEPSLHWEGFIALANVPGLGFEASEKVGYTFIDLQWNGYSLPEVKCSLLGKETRWNQSLESRRQLIHMGFWKDGRTSWFLVNRKNRAKHICPECHLRPTDKEGESCLYCRTVLSPEEIRHRQVMNRIKKNSQTLSNGGIWYLHEVQNPASLSPIYVYYLLGADELPEDFELPTGPFGSSVRSYPTTFEGQRVIRYEITMWND